MSAAVVTTTDPTLSKIRGILALEGITGQAGEVTITLTNQPAASRLFQTATVTVEGAYSVAVSTEDTFFLSMRPDGHLLVHVGPSNGATTARFVISRVDGFEYRLSTKETEYTFLENRPAGPCRLRVVIHW